MMHAQNEKDILSELNAFIEGATKNADTTNLDVSKTALSLLRTLPTARDAILEYFCRVFDVAVNNYIVRIEKEIATGEMPSPMLTREETTTISEIHTVLTSFVTSQPVAWAPIVSTWSLQLLGELSSKYGRRAQLSLSTGLNESLQLWMGCRATRTLIEISTQCLANLMHTDSECDTWMNALLDTSAKHSPNFDWVVAHVGSCFPNMVITRVLSCGLKHFCQHRTSDTEKKTQKLASVVGILGHLADTHSKDIRNALVTLLEWSMQPAFDPDVKYQKVSTVPFLLQLASVSSTLLNAMVTTANIRQMLRKRSVVLHMSGHINDWCKYFGSTKALQDLITQLILDCEQDGFQLITLLLDHICTDDEPIVAKCSEILELVLQELDSLIRTKLNAKLLNSLTSDLDELHSLLLSPVRIKYETATRLIMLMGKQNPTISMESSCYLLHRAHSYDHLVMLVRLIIDQQLNGAGGDNFEQILKHALFETTEVTIEESVPSGQMWHNLLILLKWEKKNLLSILRAQVITRAIFANILDIAYRFGDANTLNTIRHVIGELLHIAITTSKINTVTFSPQELFALINANVEYFFISCTDNESVLKIKGNKIACDLFAYLTQYSKSARVIALRTLLERSLFHKESILFGAEPSSISTDNSNELLLHKNHKHSTTLMLTQRHSYSVFHTGVIGEGKRKPKAKNSLPSDMIVCNTECLIRVLKSCCQQSDASLSLDALTLLSLLLVELISPDVMYNGLPWPEEEFAKVTIERDLYIRRMFTNTPVLWDLLHLTAVNRPILCYCSVLLRAVTATLLHQWNNNNSNNNDILMNCTIRLLDIMSLAQLLPPPLSYIREVVVKLKPYEIMLLLRNCVWNYMRDHVPSPALYGCDVNGLHWRDPTIARPPSAYTDTLRAIMYLNIDSVGEHYAPFFIKMPTSD